MPPKSAKKRETTQNGGFQPFIPPAVRSVMDQPPPTQTNSTHRHLLLPYLALGFAPTPTSGANHECGLRALWRAYRDARDALRAPGTPNIKHATLVDFRNLLESEVYRDIVTEQLITFGIFSLDEDDPVRQENMANAWRKTDLDFTNLVQLLEAANKTQGTNFELGVITQGYRCQYNAETNSWNSDFVYQTQIGIQGAEGGGRPIIWLLNTNDATRDNDWRIVVPGAAERLNHWEGFGALTDKEHRDVVMNWNLARLMREYIARGVWRVIVAQAAENGQIGVEVGAFVHEVTPPTDLQVPVGSIYAATANNERFGLISNERLVRIGLHLNAPVPADGGAEHIDLDDNLKAEGSNKGKKNEHDEQKKALAAAFQASMNSWLGSQNTLRIFRTIIPFNRIGGPLTTAELPLFTKDSFELGFGKFFLDLGERDGHWFLVRTIDSKEGWAHERCLRTLEHPWNLPSLVPFKIACTPVNYNWKGDEVADQLQKRGLTSKGDRKSDFDQLRGWDMQRTASLPMRTIDLGTEEQESGIWSDASEILDKELVLETSVIDSLGSEIISFDRETSFIGSHRHIATTRATWCIKMTVDELATLMNTVRAAVTASEQALGRAGKGKANETTENRQTIQIKQEPDTREGPVSPKEKFKNSNGKRMIQDDDEDELAQEPKSPPQKKSRQSK